MDPHILPVELDFSFAQFVRGGVLVPHIPHLPHPFAEWQRELAFNQIYEALLTAACGFAGRAIYKTLRRASGCAAVGFTDSGKHRLSPGRVDVGERLVTVVADSMGMVERLVQRVYGIFILQFAGCFLRFLESGMDRIQTLEQQQILPAQFRD